MIRSTKPKFKILGTLRAFSFRKRSSINRRYLGLMASFRQIFHWMKIRTYYAMKLLITRRFQFNRNNFKTNNLKNNFKTNNLKRKLTIWDSFYSFPQFLQFSCFNTTLLHKTASRPFRTNFETNKKFYYFNEDGQFCKKISSLNKKTKIK